MGQSGSTNAGRIIFIFKPIHFFLAFYEILLLVALLNVERSLNAV